MMISPSRRRFLASAPLAAAAASLALTNKTALSEAAAAPAMAEPVKVFTAAQLTEDRKKLEAEPGNNVLFTSDNLPVAVTMTTEKAKAAKEFEWHEGRDHVIQIIEGETIYELGGTPSGGHSTKPGEWLAPASEGAMKYTMKAGDMVVIPRGTPHKRTTPKSVTLYLIATTGK
jgi:mannose-6-phosphate isomerase-like protein (cupin superfamily)